MRITLLIIAGFLIIAGTGFFVLLRTSLKNVERQYSQAAEEPLVDFAYLLAGVLEQDIVDGKIDVTKFRAGFSSAYEREVEAKIYSYLKTDILTQVYVTNEEGIVLFDSDKGNAEGKDYSRENDVVLVMRGDYGVRSTRIDPNDSRSTVLYVAAPIEWEGGTIGVLTVARPETAMAPFAEETRQLFLKWSLAAAGTVIVLGAVWTYWLLSPIGEVTAFARRVKEGVRTVAPRAGHAELRELSEAVDEMRKELEGRNYVENYVQALTHELKSPLAAIRGAAELIDEEMPADDRARFLGNIRAETDRSERIVSRLVQLAALESQSELAKVETINLASLMDDEIRETESQLENKKLSIIADGIDQKVEIQGDRIVLQMAVRNLLANAIDFSPAKGTIEIVLNEGPPAFIEIRDRGPGIPDYAVEKVFDRFYSLKHQTTGRKSSGLGLCFVREAMTLHGGVASIENRKGGGLTAKLTFS